MKVELLEQISLASDRNCALMVFDFFHGVAVINKVDQRRAVSKIYRLHGRRLDGSNVDWRLSAARFGKHVFRTEVAPVARACLTGVSPFSCVRLFVTYEDNGGSARRCFRQRSPPVFRRDLQLPAMHYLEHCRPELNCLPVEHHCIPIAERSNK